MSISPHNPFKGREFPGEVIVLCVRWYFRYPLSCEHVTERVAERGVEVDASGIRRWVQVSNKSYRIDETCSCSSSLVVDAQTGEPKVLIHSSATS
jgi:transposase-like protein